MVRRVCVTIHVAPNTPPTFTTTPTASATVGTLYTYDVVIADPDGNPLTITAPTLPTWLTLADHHNGTATLSGTPAADNAGANAVVLRVSDSVTHVDQSWSLTVALAVVPSVNHAPVIEDSATTPFIADALKLFTHTFITSDVDGDTLIITLENAPAWLTVVQSGTGAATVAGIPDLTNLGATQTFDLIVSDGENSVRESYDITVPAWRFRLDDAGTLAVAGTNSPDDISISLRDATTLRLVHNGFAKNFALAGVKAIEIYGQDGNDLVSVSSGAVPTYVLGGAGNDTLVGGDEPDNFVGGGGKDSLIGGRGNDRLNGLGGNDTLAGNDGDDRLYGGDGNDLLVAGNGRDRCYGEAGDDFFITRGDNKPDLLYGGAGNDAATTDAGIDHLDDVLPV